MNAWHTQYNLTLRMRRRDDSLVSNVFFKVRRKFSIVMEEIDALALFPPCFKYKVVKFKSANAESFSCEMRSDILNVVDADKFVRLFAESTTSHYKVWFDFVALVYCSLCT